MSSIKTKLVCQLVMNIEGKLSSYTAFNDAIESFCRIVNYNKTAAEAAGLKHGSTDHWSTGRKSQVKGHSHTV